MPLGVDHALSAIAHVPHQTPGTGWAFSSPTADLLLMIAFYLIAPVVLVVFGLLGWQGRSGRKRGGGGGGGGGGGHGRPPAGLPPPGGGRQLSPDENPPDYAGDDFAAWEAQLQAPDHAPADDDHEVQVGRSWDNWDSWDAWGRWGRDGR